MKKTLFILSTMKMPDGDACCIRENDIASFFKKREFHIVYICYLNPSFKTQYRTMPLYRENADYYLFERPRTPFGWMKWIFSTRFIKKILKHYQGQKYLLFVDYFVFAELRLLHYSKKECITVINDAQEWFPRTLNVIKNVDTSLRMKITNKKVSNLICSSSSMAKKYTITAKNLVIFPAIVEGSGKRNVSSFNESYISLIYCGVSGGHRMKKENIVTLINSVTTFNNRNKKKIKLLLVGPSKNDYFQKGKLNDENILFLGKKGHEECLSLIENSNFSVIPREKTRQNEYGFPTKLSESFSCGTPVISTNTSDISKYLFDGINGFLLQSCLQSSFISCFEKIANLSVDDFSLLRKNVVEMNRLKLSNFQDDFSLFIDRLG